jgi:hypothetical protein
MARVTCSPDESDANFQIEAAVAEKLRAGETAEISLSSIQANYDVLEAVDHGEIATPFHKLAHFDQIVATLHEFGIDDAEYEIQGEDISFHRKAR